MSQVSDAALHAWLQTDARSTRIVRLRPYAAGGDPSLPPVVSRLDAAEIGSRIASWRAASPPLDALFLQGIAAGRRPAPVRPDPLVDGQRARGQRHSRRRPRRWRPMTQRCGSTSASTLARLRRGCRGASGVRAGARARSGARPALGLAWRWSPTRLPTQRGSRTRFHGGAAARPAALRSRLRPRPAVLRAAALRRGGRPLATRDRRRLPQPACPCRARSGAVLHRRLLRRRARTGDLDRQRRRRRPEAHAPLRSGALPRGHDRRRRRRRLRRLSRSRRRATRKTTRPSRAQPFRCSAPMAIATRRSASAAHGAAGPTTTRSSAICSTQ